MKICLIEHNGFIMNNLLKHNVTRYEGAPFDIEKPHFSEYVEFLKFPIRIRLMRV